MRRMKLITKKKNEIDVKIKMNDIDQQNVIDEKKKNFLSFKKLKELKNSFIFLNKFKYRR